MKEEVYMVYSDGDPNILVNEQGMDGRMQENTHILLRNPGIFPDDLELARTIWKKIRNPRVVTNELSHPNNWTSFDLVSLAREIHSYDMRP